MGADPHDTGALPPPEREYLRAIAAIVRRQCGSRVVGLYLFGSAAYGAYDPGRSDLDIQLVVATPPDEATLRALAGSLSHTALPCPARRLEFVLYERAAIDPAVRHPRFLLNFNTGADLAADRVVLDPGAEASHWFLLDIAMGRALGQALLGPPPDAVFAPIPRPWCLAALADSLAWHGAHEVASGNSLRNACRGWRYAATGVFGSKEAGANWAIAQPDCPPPIAAALRRSGGDPVAPAAAHAFLQLVAAAVGAAIERERRSG